MTIMEKNAIWFIVFLEISLDKFIWDGKCQRAEGRRMFLCGLFFGKLWYSTIKVLLTVHRTEKRIYTVTVIAGKGA